MSKFVTYPAVTVLDNDHSLLIDDPNAGTNSITAENAGNTLLSKWAGFETFDEAVQNTISNNQEFIDRDAAIREETAELKKKIVTTFPAKEASGAVATFESEFEDAPLKSCIVQIEPVQDLHGYDSPWPAGGGKNLLFNQAKTTTIYGITFTVKDDGTVIANGTATSTTQFECKFLGLIPAGNYYFTGCPSGGSFATYDVYPWDDTTGARLKNWDGTTNAKSDFGAYTLQQIQIPEGHSGKLVLRVISGVTVNNIIFKPMVVKSTETDSSYTPYKNICPISGWTGCEVQRTGVNLLGGIAMGQAIVDAVNVSSNTYLGSDEDGDYVTFAAGGVIDEKVVFTEFKPNTQYTIILKYKKGNIYSKNINIGVRYTDGMFETFIANVPAELQTKAFVTQAGKSVLRLETTFGGSRTFLYYNESGIFEGVLTATDFVPSTGQTYPITFPTEAGTVYGGYIDPINGELVVDRAFHSFTGDETLAQTRTNVVTARFLQTFENSGYNQNKTCCSHYKTSASTSWNNLKSGEFMTSGRLVGFYSSSTSDFSAYLSAQNSAGTPVTIAAVLTKPVHYPLTPTEIKTLLGTNNIWSNTGDTAVEYLMSDVSWYVEKKLRAFQSILAGVEDSSTASKNYSANTYLIFNDDIYKTTKAITAGETIEEGVNVTKTTVAEQLLALAQA